MGKITIHDVAEKAGVSISTVHQALNGKKGVSEETRKRIRKIAEEMEYQPNPIASSLKRKHQKIAVIIPQSNYYKPVWHGVRDYLNSATKHNLSWTEMPFNESDSSALGGMLDTIFAEEIDGILITGHSEVFTKENWQEIHEKGIAVSLIGADMPDSHRIFCIMPDYEIIGRTMAELVLSRIPVYGSIAICAGNPKWDPHKKVVQGFESYLKECGAPNRVYRDNSWNRKQESYAGILEMMRQPDIAACCSVLSQSSALLGRAILELGKKGMVFAVGSDFADENIQYLKEGVFNNLIQKNPYTQGYLGSKSLVEYLTMGRQHVPERVFVGSEVVFKSNVSMYQDKSYRSLLI